MLASEDLLRKQARDPETHDSTSNLQGTRACTKLLDSRMKRSPFTEKVSDYIKMCFSYYKVKMLQTYEKRKANVFKTGVRGFLSHMGE